MQPVHVTPQQLATVAPCGYAHEHRTVLLELHHLGMLAIANVKALDE
jgi:hypothetical protein